MQQPKYPKVEVSRFLPAPPAAAGKAGKIVIQLQRSSKKLRNYSFERITDISVSLKCLVAEISPAVLA